MMEARNASRAVSLEVRREILRSWRTVFCELSGSADGW